MISINKQLNEKEIYNLLLLTNEYFKPNPLSERVDLAKYSKKLSEKAKHFSLWEQDVLIGICCCYVNNVIDKKAFKSIICIHPKWQGKGLGKMLTQAVEDYLYHNGFQYLESEVHIENKNSIKMHEAIGFRIDRIVDNSLVMIKEIL